MKQHHFYASSVAEWMTTTPHRDIRQLLKLMDKDGYPYSLWLVPLPHDANYQIERYAPKVEGAILIGTFNK